MGGVCKTTLAESVYNDHKVDKQFKLKSWIYFSVKFDISKLIIDGSEVLVSSLPRTSAIQDLESDKCEEPQLQQPNQQWNHIELKDVMV
ncbi:hypothetical protein FEM48_Zijuj10G0023800 [Ziziphus jujuba var. spinosa]|uniref:NB-ARC domain-containing protein n=1 Tax=Ziziphus jujuba var. spinosa TaxID=714518 RepID=A0A978UKR1_ZIZJJ|nr:hypothetical protein FEM48_Zijuj10G0023800 [Ziziphus jujuba var. spinosa]